MARIFISHSSKDSFEAAALKQWLADNGWAEVFLDLDARQGLSPGERWKDALRSASDRCEAVLCLVSPELQQRPAPEEIPALRALLAERGIVADAVCTKMPERWQA